MKGDREVVGEESTRMFVIVPRCDVTEQLRFMPEQEVAQHHVVVRLCLEALPQHRTHANGLLPAHRLVERLVASPHTNITHTTHAADGTVDSVGGVEGG